MASSYDGKLSSSSSSSSVVVPPPSSSSWWWSTCCRRRCCRRGSGGCRNFSVPYYGVIILTVLYVIHCVIIWTTLPNECWIDGEWLPLVDCLPSSYSSSSSSSSSTTATTTNMTTTIRINHSVMSWSTLYFIAATAMALGVHLVCKTSIGKLSGTVFFSLMAGYTIDGVKLMFFPVPTIYGHDSNGNDNADGDSQDFDLDSGGGDGNDDENSTSEGGIDYHYLLTMISYVCWTLAITMLGWFVIQCRSEEDDVHVQTTIAKGGSAEATSKVDDNNNNNNDDDDGYSQSMESTTSFGRSLRRGQICCIEVMEIFYILLTLIVTAGVSTVICCIMFMSLPPTSSMVSTLLNAYTVSVWIWEISISLFLISIAYILTAMAKDAYKELPVSYVSVAGLSPTLAGWGIVLMQLTVMITQMLHLPFYRQDETSSYMNFARISPIVVNYGSLMTIYFIHNFMFSFFDKDRWEDEDLDLTDDDEGDDNDVNADIDPTHNTAVPVICNNEVGRVGKTGRGENLFDLETGKMKENTHSVTEYVCEVGPPSWMRKRIQYEEDTDDKSAVVIAEMNGNVFSCSQIGCVATGQSSPVVPIEKSKEAGRESKLKRKVTIGVRRNLNTDPHVSSNDDEGDIEVVGDVPASPKTEDLSLKKKFWFPRWRRDENENGSMSEDHCRSNSKGGDIDQSRSRWRHNEFENGVVSGDQSKSESVGKMVDQSYSRSPDENHSPINYYSDSMSMDATDVEFPDPRGGLYFSGHGIDETAVQSERRDIPSKSFLGTTVLKPKRSRRKVRNKKNKKKALKALEVPQSIDENNEKTFDGSDHWTKRFSIASDSKHVGSIYSNNSNSIVVSEIEGDAPSKNAEYHQQKNRRVVTGHNDENKEEHQKIQQHNPTSYVQQLAFSGRARKRGDRGMTVNAAGEVSSLVSGGTEQSPSLSQKMNRVSLMQQSESFDEGNDESTLSSISTLESIEKVSKAESFAMSVIPQMIVRMFETRDDDDDTDLGTLEDGSTIDTSRSWRQQVLSKQNQQHQTNPSSQQREGSVTSSPSTSKNSISSRYIPKYIPSGLPQPVVSAVTNQNDAGEEEKSVWTKTSGTSSAVTTPVKNSQNLKGTTGTAASTGSGIYYGRYVRNNTNNQLSSYMDSVLEENDDDEDDDEEAEWESIGEHY